MFRLCVRFSNTSIHAYCNTNSKDLLLLCVHYSALPHTCESVLFEFIIAMLLLRTLWMWQHAVGQKGIGVAPLSLLMMITRSSSSEMNLPTKLQGITTQEPVILKLVVCFLVMEWNKESQSVSRGTWRQKVSRLMTWRAITTGTHITQRIYHTNQTVSIHTVHSSYRFDIISHSIWLWT